MQQLEPFDAGETTRMTTRLLTSPVCVPTSSRLASSDSWRVFMLKPEPVPSLVRGADPPR